MKEIGGYFELELSSGSGIYHDTPFAFKTAGASLNYIITQINPSKIYVPYYTCDSLLQPLRDKKVAFEFYPVNDMFEIDAIPLLKENEYIIYINYFDCKRAYTLRLYETIGDKLIVDNAQAFFWQPPISTWSFNSVRKFFGVPDGSYLYAPKKYTVATYNLIPRNTNYKIDHLLLRLNGQVSQGYDCYKENERLCDAALLRMSLLSEKLMSQVDYAAIIARRRANYEYIHQQLGEYNLLKTDLTQAGEPLYYPFLPSYPLLHKQLWEKNIFAPVLWKECLERTNNKSFAVEKDLAANLLPLPVDHRYSLQDMQIMCELILSFRKDH